MVINNNNHNIQYTVINWFNNQYSKFGIDRIFINAKLPTPMADYKKSETQL